VSTGSWERDQRGFSGLGLCDTELKGQESKGNSHIKAKKVKKPLAGRGGEGITLYHTEDEEKA